MLYVLYERSHQHLIETEIFVTDPARNCQNNNVLLVQSVTKSSYKVLVSTKADMLLLWNEHHQLRPKSFKMRTSGTASDENFIKITFSV